VNSIDFSAPSLEFNFQVGTNTTACIDVNILDDDNLEGDHSFTVDLGGMITPNLTAGFGSQSSTAITIRDPEGMFIQDMSCIAIIRVQTISVPHNVVANTSV